jgi:hypothetical protein
VIFGNSASMGAILIGSDEIAYRHGKLHVLGCREGIEAQTVFQSSNQHSDAEGIEPGIKQRKVVAERGKRLPVFARNLRHLVHYS